MSSSLPRQYREFDPETRWLSSEEGAETLIVHLPRFQKEQLRVEPTPTRLLMISGQRPLGGNRWLRFLKEVQLPLGCDPEEITAKTGGGVLYVRRPKLVTPTEPQDKPDQITAPAPQSPETQPMPAPAKTNVAKAEKAEERRVQPEADARRDKKVKMLVVIVMVMVALALAIHLDYGKMLVVVVMVA